MARVEGSCTCEEWDCNVHYIYKDADHRRPKTEDARETWVDAVTAKCRPCEIDHGQRWGHNTAKAEEATEGPGERVI